MYDVVISGAGPSGSQCAETLAKSGFKVALIERDVKWRKPCGGSVSSKVIALYPQLKKLKLLKKNSIFFCIASLAWKRPGVQFPPGPLFLLTSHNSSEKQLK